jgi:hypothetical protein
MGTRNAPLQPSMDEELLLDSFLDLLSCSLGAIFVMLVIFASQYNDLGQSQTELHNWPAIINNTSIMLVLEAPPTGSIESIDVYPEPVEPELTKRELMHSDGWTVPLNSDNSLCVVVSATAENTGATMTLITSDNRIIPLQPLSSGRWKIRLLSTGLATEPDGCQ